MTLNFSSSVAVNETFLSFSPTLAPGRPAASILFSRYVISTTVFPSFAEVTLNFTTIFIVIVWSIF